jgi:hypothetical protein
VEREFDIFEVMSDGSAVWRAGGLSLGTVEVTILEFGQKSRHEFFAMHLPTKEIIARVNHGREEASNTDGGQSSMRE